MEKNNNSNQNIKIALVENFGSDFYGARLRYAKFLKNKGHDVIAVIPNDGYVEKIEIEGVPVISIDIDVRKRNIKNVRTYIKELKKIFKKEQFDVIHLYRLQPNLLGTFIAYKVNRSHRIINHITGLGMAFTKKSIKYKLIQFIVKSGYKINSKIFNAQLIFQNNEDKKELGNYKDFMVVKGSAVNEDKFFPEVTVNEELQKDILKTANSKTINLIFVSRLLKQKGLTYLIKAVKDFNLKDNNTKLNLIIAGWIDTNNPDSFTESEIKELGSIDSINFLGRRTDINQLIAISDIAILPTFYREGTPRFLLEAMAMKKPIITTDMPGCNHLVKDSKNGILVKPKSSEEIIKAIEKLINSDLSIFGDNSKDIYDKEFSETIVYNKLLSTYN